MASRTGLLNEYVELEEPVSNTYVPCRKVGNRIYYTRPLVIRRGDVVRWRGRRFDVLNVSQKTGATTLTVREKI